MDRIDNGMDETRQLVILRKRNGVISIDRYCGTNDLRIEIENMIDRAWYEGVESVTVKTREREYIIKWDGQ